MKRAIAFSAFLICQAAAFAEPTVYDQTNNAKLSAQQATCVVWDAKTAVMGSCTAWEKAGLVEKRANRYMFTPTARRLGKKTLSVFDNLYREPNNYGLGQ